MKRLFRLLATTTILAPLISFAADPMKPNRFSVELRQRTGSIPTLEPAWSFTYGI